MSNKLYKGFIVRHDSSTYENTTWDGQRYEGNGTYTKEYFTEIIDPKTGKSLRFDNEAEATAWIDNQKENKAKNKKLDTEIKKMKDKFERLTEQGKEIDRECLKIGKEIEILRLSKAKELR